MLEYIALVLSILALVVAVLGNLYITYQKNKALRFSMTSKSNGISGCGQGYVIPKTENKNTIV